MLVILEKLLIIGAAIYGSHVLMATNSLWIAIGHAALVYFVGMLLLIVFGLSSAVSVANIVDQKKK